MGHQGHGSWTSSEADANALKPIRSSRSLADFTSAQVEANSLGQVIPAPAGGPGSNEMLSWAQWGRNPRHIAGTHTDQYIKLVREYEQQQLQRQKHEQLKDNRKVDNCSCGNSDKQNDARCRKQQGSIEEIGKYSRSNKKEHKKQEDANNQRGNKKADMDKVRGVGDGKDARGGQLSAAERAGAGRPDVSSRPATRQQQQQQQRTFPTQAPTDRDNRLKKRRHQREDRRRKAKDQARGYKLDPDVPPLWTVRRGMSRGVHSGYGGSGGNCDGSGDVTSSQRKASRLMNHAGAIAGAAS